MAWKPWCVRGDRRDIGDSPGGAARGGGGGLGPMELDEGSNCGMLVGSGLT
jgi:hypothetical protein